MVYFQRIVFRKGCHLEMLEEKIRELYRITAELEEKYPGRCFTPDGHLVGSIGEVYAAEKYGLILLEASSEKHDARSTDGRLIQIKITQTDRVSIYSKPDYRFCGRYISELRFEEHFQVYELQLFDIAELILTANQEQDLNKLIECESEKYKFAKAEDIRSRGMNFNENKLYEWIGSHTKFILQEYESHLLDVAGTGKVFTVML